MKLREFTSKLSFNQIYQIMDDFEKFEEEGVIGDCLLRETARNIQFAITEKHENIVMWMNLVANDCYRIIAEKALKTGFYYNNGRSFEFIYRKPK